MYALGIDFGTSGARTCLIDPQAIPVWEARISYTDAASPAQWRDALFQLLSQLPLTYATQLNSISLNGTSGTVLLCDQQLQPTSPALLYNDTRATSGLAKFLWLTSRYPDAHYFLHQCDWLTAQLTGQAGISDYHNALKTGYDVVNLCWPESLLALPHSHLLPQVLSPGAAIAPLQHNIAQQFGINPDCLVHAGTTDSNAAFIASGVTATGIGVTSLGTTLVLKQLSEQRIDAPEYGIYSHRFGKLWLVGGASNAGAGVLQQFFNNQQLDELSRQIAPDTISPLDYYPLPSIGERFPYNDPQREPHITPRPNNDVAFLHGLLQGLANIEKMGYQKLAELGASNIHTIISNGGGAKSETWQQIRSQVIGVPVSRAKYDEASYGTALLPQLGF